MRHVRVEASLRASDQQIETYARIAEGNRRRFEKLEVVLRALRAEGVDCLLLKGADLISRVYGVMGLRPMVDVDLLVHEHDLPAIDRTVRRLGYRPQLSGNPVYVDPEGELWLDLVTSVWYLGAAKKIWARARHGTLRGLPVKGMGTSDLLVYLTAYTVIHRGWLSSAFAQDIALLIEREPVDWDLVVGQAVRHDLRVVLFHGLEYAGRRAGARVPADVLRHLAPTTAGEHALRWLLWKLVSEDRVADLGHVLLFLTQPGLRRWRWLAGSLFPSRAFLTYRYGAFADTHPIRTRLCRPLYLAVQGLKVCGKVLRLLARQPAA